jgi:hypothetical protein
MISRKQTFDIDHRQADLRYPRRFKHRSLSASPRLHILEAGAVTLDIPVTRRSLIGALKFSAGWIL